MCHIVLYSSYLALAGGALTVESSVPSRTQAQAVKETKLATAVLPRLPKNNAAGRPVLERGSRGPQVKVVQRKLGISVDGIYGPVTENAVRDFQRDHGLAVDGIVGPRTWAALDKAPKSGNKGNGGNGAKGSGAAAAVAYARAQVGDSYVYGADGPDAFDCSGLTMMAWRQAGVSLPHSSAAQASRGTAVTWSGLRPGDLIFTYDPISHVGIYVGGGKMVAASNPDDGVELIELNSYWRQNFTAARRIRG